MLIGLFLLYLAAFVAVFYSARWLFDFLVNATVIDSVTFIFALGGGIAIVILARTGMGGVTIAVTILVFWSFLIFGVDYATVTITLDVSGAVLIAAAAAVLSETFLRRPTGK